MKHKIISNRRISALCQKYRKAGKKIVFTNGTFDILHAGHVDYLEKAKKFGAILIVGMNSDRSVKTYKDPSRPINPQQDRSRVLAALECVDHVVMFEEPTPLKLIVSVKPHVLVKGSDWKKSQIAGAREVESWGGQVRRVRLVPGRSTTAVIKKITNARKR